MPGTGAMQRPRRPFDLDGLIRRSTSGDLDENAYLELQRLIYRVAEALRKLLAPIRVYVLSLGSAIADESV